MGNIHTQRIQEQFEEQGELERGRKEGHFNSDCEFTNREVSQCFVNQFLGTEAAHRSGAQLLLSVET